MRTGLVMEGGAMRGMFTAGVIDVLMENRVRFDGAIGVSAGAAFGCNYKSGQIGRVIRYNTKYSRDKRYCGLACLIRTGNLYSTEFAYGEVPLYLDPFDFAAYRENPMDFYVVCTDVRSGEAIYHRYEGWEDHGFDWIRASASLPLVSRMVEIDGRRLLDGGIADSVPLRYFQEQGYDKNVVILTQPADYRKKKDKALPLLRLRYRAYPGLLRDMEQRHTVYNNTLAYIEEEEKKGAVVVIRPEEALPIKRTEKDPERMRAAYRIGRQTAEERLDAVKVFLTDAKDS